jgi:hypothetical protein
MAIADIPRVSRILSPFSLARLNYFPSLGGRGKGRGTSEGFVNVFLRCDS